MTSYRAHALVDGGAARRAAPRQIEIAPAPI
jgi:hypothetical protein